MLHCFELKALNKAIKDRPQKNVGWTRSARPLWRRYGSRELKERNSN